MAEYFDIRRPDGSLTGEVVERSEAHAKGYWHAGSHIWLWRVKDGVPELLLQHRAPCKASYPDCYDISAAGHVDAGESYLEAAKRELSEEVGVTASEENLIFIGWMNEDNTAEFYGKPYINREVDALYIYECNLEEDEFTLQPTEVDGVKWMRADEIIPKAEAGEWIHCLRFDEVQRVIDAVEAELSKR